MAAKKHASAGGVDTNKLDILVLIDTNCQNKCLLRQSLKKNDH
ncbi:MAG: hypothetical protein [Microvirus sp.]|nr:MAG: hypothetical protein [Microvirus sp.]